MYLNDMAKLLKNRVFYIIRGYMVGCDQINNLLTYVKLDSNIFNNWQLDSCCINARDLSAFIKNITIETKFDVFLDNDGYWHIRTMNGTDLTINQRPNIQAYDMIVNMELLSTESMVPEEDVTDGLNGLYSLKKDDGIIKFIHHQKYFITLFQPIIPLTKTDRIYLSILPGQTAGSFVAKFRIAKKKNQNVFVYIAYLYV